jgi:hypothetical protein
MRGETPAIRGSSWRDGLTPPEAITVSKEATPALRGWSSTWSNIGFRIASEHQQEHVYNERGGRRER